MTNSEKLRQSTELLAARGQGFSDGLRWVLKLIKADKTKHIEVDANYIIAIIKAKMENPSG